MTEWALFMPVVVAASTIVFLPGLVVGLTLRLRGILLWGFAPAGGTAVLSVTAVMLGLVGVRWSWGSAALGVLALTALSALIGRALRPVRLELRDARPGLIVGAIVLGAVIGATRMAALIGHPGNLSQTNDATFHLNALRFIAETGHASSLELLGTLHASGFYPAAWHSIASLVMDLTGADAVGAANATSLAIAGPVWTVSITALVWCVTRGSRAAAIAAALMAPALFAFPFDMLDFGVLYPYALAVAIMPGVLAIIVGSLSAAPGEQKGNRARRIWTAIVATAVGIMALGLAQPSSVLIWLTGAVCISIWALIVGFRAASPRDRRRRMLGILAVVVGGVGLWLAVTRVSSSALWGPRKPLTGAVLDLLLNDAAGPGPAIVVSALSAIGIVIAFRVSHLRWFAAFGVVVFMMTAAALSVQNEMVRGLLAAWYADHHRFVAMMPLVVVPFAAIAVDHISSSTKRRRWVGAVVATVLLAAVVVETVAWTAVATRLRWGSYDSSASSYLSPDEDALLRVLPEYVGTSDRVLGNPSAGAAFGYALSGVDVFPRTWAMPQDADFQELRWNLTGISDDSAVCAAVERMDVDYVLDFGKSAAGAGKWDMPGLTGFGDRQGFRLVAERGTASLWRIEDCDAE